MRSALRNRSDAFETGLHQHFRRGCGRDDDERSPERARRASHLSDPVHRKELVGYDHELWCRVGRHSRHDLACVQREVNVEARLSKHASKTPSMLVGFMTDENASLRNRRSVARVELLQVG